MHGKLPHSLKAAHCAYVLPGTWKGLVSVKLIACTGVYYASTVRQLHSCVIASGCTQQSLHAGVW